jgi:hypothetical protein
MEMFLKSALQIDCQLMLVALMHPFRLLTGLLHSFV